MGIIMSNLGNLPLFRAVGNLMANLAFGKEEKDLFDEPFFTRAEFTWTKKEVRACIPELRNQGRASVCYAYALTGCIYADYVIKNPRRLALMPSIQELVDKLQPSRAWVSNQGMAARGTPNSFRAAFEYVESHGLYTEEQYPRDRGGFRNPSGYHVTQKPDWKIYVHGHRRIPVNNPDVIIQRLRKQPLIGALYFNDTLADWKENDGIYPGPNDEQLEELKMRRELNLPLPRHTLLIIAYGTEDGIDYFQCQGSYGTPWGFHGYINVARTAIIGIWYTYGAIYTNDPALVQAHNAANQAHIAANH